MPVPVPRQMEEEEAAAAERTSTLPHSHRKADRLSSNRSLLVRQNHSATAGPAFPAATVPTTTAAAAAAAARTVKEDRAEAAAKAAEILRNTRAGDEDSHPKEADRRGLRPRKTAWLCQVLGSAAVAAAVAVWPEPELHRRLLRRKCSPMPSNSLHCETNTTAESRP